MINSLLSRLATVAQNLLGVQPTLYLRDLPNDTFASSNGSRYFISNGGFAYPYVYDMRGQILVGRPIDQRSPDLFSQGAVATLPNRLQYSRWGSAWLLVPTPGAVPVTLTEQVPGHQECWVIQQIPYTRRGPAFTPLVLSYNVTMPQVTEGNFPGANEPVFTAAAGEKVQEKISIVIDILTAPSERETLKSSSQVRVPVHATKRQLAQIIVSEVEKALATSDNALVAFLNQTVVQKLSFDDLVLVDLVRVSTSTYQPTIALRVGA